MPMIPKKTNAAAAPATTAAPAATPAPAPAVEAAAPAATPAPAPAQTTAVAPVRSTAVAMAGRPVDVIAEDFKNKLPLEWNTLHRLQANNGNFLDLENQKKPLGDEITLNLMTYQDNWQISPGTDDANDTQYVRYSDDGITTKQGENCQEYLQAMKEAGYVEAKMTQRVTLAGEIVRCAKVPDMEGKLVQIDLSTTSKNMFNRHQFQVSLDVARNKVDREATGLLKMTATVASGKGRSWTQVAFSYGQPA